MDCIFALNADGKLHCTVCGWTYPREPNADPAKWPKRNCPSPEAIKADAESEATARAGADKLGVSWSDARHYLAALAAWGKAGFPAREQSEVERIERELCRPCAEYLDGRCKACGCRVTLGPALTNKIRMATERCKKGKW
jgi:hypothetical protein